MAANPEAELRRLFGHDAFRAGQGEVVQAALEGTDTLALMPTGAGKSLCYQLPAMLLDGVTLVVSPLIALMKDQLDALPQPVYERTTLINSSLGRDEVRERLERVASGEVKLVYAAPERLRQQPFLHALRRAGVRLFVVDEAHCALLWGADFRPDYLFIPRALEALGDPPLLALTATATLAMQDELRRVLRRDLEVISTGVLRDNLHLSVQRAANDEQKLRALAELCADERGSGIVYVNSREKTEELARILRRKGVLASPYHAGLSQAERARVQDDFMLDRLRVVTATVAFGMGVDKRNVRFIAHYGLPRSLEAYTQESGRAGRDGQPARCVILYSSSDKANLTRWQREDALDLDALRRVYRCARREVGEPPRWGALDSAALLEAVNDGQTERLSETELRVALSVLERAGLVERGFDAPRGGALQWLGTPEPASQYAQLAEATAGGRVDLVDLAERLDQRPDAAERLLLEAEDAALLSWHPGQRQPLVRLLEPPPDAPQRMQALLGRAGREDEAEVRRVVEYAEARGCRLRVIAAHFGVRLFQACGHCDLCDGTDSALGTESVESALRADPRALEDPAEVIRACLAGLPFNVGKKGLGRILTGSVASPIKADRCPQYGALAGVAPSAVERIVDQLLREGYLERGDDEFATLRIGSRWAGSDVPDVAPLTVKVPAGKKVAGGRATLTPTLSQRERGRDAGSGSASAAGDGSLPGFPSTEMTAEALDRFERLRAWRTARARADKVPPYVIFHDATLRALAQAEPRDEAALLRVAGVGPAKVERYGADLLDTLHGPTDPAEPMPS